MCGIVAIRSRAGNVALQEVASRMARRIVHRGPDDSGVWVDHDAGVAFAHQRLSIVDLSPLGRQPMVSHDGRYVLCYNGEVYNFRDLRDQLGDVTWRGHSDTEVILECIARVGLAKAVEQLNGMFAFAVFDRKEQVFTCVRDRVGVKPLYYWPHASGFYCASELKALLAAGLPTPQVDRSALASYLRYGYIAAPATIFEGIYKLQPGTLLEVSATGALHEQRYWDALSRYRVAIENPLLDEFVALRELDGLLRDSIGRRMLADVPLGAFLSGGVDSTLVVAIMQSLSTTPVRTFTIGFGESQYNEAPHARAIADYLKTEHTEIAARPEDALAWIPKLAQTFDEPFADSSSIPTQLVAQLTRQHVTVALSGDGGDELFAGYTRYAKVRELMRMFEYFPAGLRSTLGEWLTRLPSHTIDQLAHALPYAPARIGDRLGKLASALRARDVLSVYQVDTSSWADPAAVLCGVDAEWQAPAWQLVRDLEAPATSQMQLLDILTYLPDDIMTKVDRTTMAVSLEAREPLLDYRLIEWSLRIPASLHSRGNGKWLLKRALDAYVPRHLWNRPKQGFAVPLAAWLRGPLRSWADRLLDLETLHDEGFFRPEIVNQRWHEHVAGVQDWQHQLWPVLMFQAWRAEYLPTTR